MKPAGLLASAFAIAAVGGNMWLGWNSYEGGETPISEVRFQIPDAQSQNDTALHIAHPGSGEPDDAPMHVEEILALGRTKKLSREKNVVHPMTSAELAGIMIRLGM